MDFARQATDRARLGLGASPSTEDASTEKASTGNASSVDAASAPAAAQAAPRGVEPSNGGTAAEPARRVAPADERAAIYTDPAMRRIFDTLEARLVEVKAPKPVVSAPAASAPMIDDTPDADGGDPKSGK